MDHALIGGEFRIHGLFSWVKAKMDSVDPKNVLRSEAGALERFLAGLWTFSRRSLIAIIVLLLVLIAGRIALPFVLKSAINGRLNQIPGYAGQVAKVHVAVWRGAYDLRDVEIVKRQGSKTVPLFAAKAVDFSVAWRELFHGKFVGDITVEEGRVNFVRTATPETSQLEVDKRWQDAIEAIFPIEITHLTIIDGRVRYIDRTSNPVVDESVENIQGVATGLRNHPKKNAGEFPAHMRLTGTSTGGGRLSASADAEPLADHPHFEMRLKLEKVSLPALNPFLRSFAGVDVSAGTLKFYMEIAARDGRFEGYAKPFFTGVKFTNLTEGSKPVTQRVWQALASGLVELLKNKPENELSTRIPFSGEFGRTDVGIWATITSMLHNGFINALVPSLEHNVKSATIAGPKPLAVR